MSRILAGRRRLILASTSPFRRELLARLGLPFETLAPKADETPLPGENASTLVTRLAESKARSIAEQNADALIIGSDQAATLEGKILGKPGDHEHATAQLANAAGKAMIFYTGLCLLDAASGQIQIDVIPFKVVFRPLTPAQIESYLRREQPYQCAGSFKSEGLGIALFHHLEGDDPTSLIGLPLIRLTQMLETAGVAVL